MLDVVVTACLMKMRMARCCPCLCESEHERTCLWNIHEMYVCVFV